MKIAIAATLIASASAFAPVAQKASSSALKMGYESEAGVTSPAGFFDPLVCVFNITYKFLYVIHGLSFYIVFLINVWKLTQ